MKLFKDFDSTIDIKQSIIIEKVVTKPRSAMVEILRTFFIIGTVALLSWGISYADEIPLIKEMISKSDTPQESQRTFSTRGQTSEVSATLVTIRNAKNREGETGFSYKVDVTGAYIKSYTGEALSLSDIKTNQEVVAKGQLTGDTIIAHTFIIFGDLPPLELTATTTEAIATSTEEFSTTTEDISTSTQGTASSTDSIIDTITDTVDGVIDRLTDTITSIIDTLTGTSTDPIIPQNPSDTATSTDMQEEPIEDTTSSTSTAPALEESIEPELEPLVDEVIEEESVVESIPETVSEPANTEFQ